MDEKEQSIKLEVEPDVILEVDEESEEDEDDLSNASLNQEEELNNQRIQDMGEMNMITPDHPGFTFITQTMMNGFFNPMLQSFKVNVEKVSSNRMEQCPHCGQYYRRLARHMIKHIKGEDYPITTCNYCKKDFNTYAALEIHLRSHNGTKPFICKVCDKAFSQNCNLINHMRIHTGDKPFACRFCDKKFSQSGNLKNHERLHSDEKPFVCSVCSQAFRQISNLNSHSKKHLFVN